MAKIIVSPEEVAGKTCIVLPLGENKFKIIAKAGKHVTRHGKVVPVFAAIKGIDVIEGLNTAETKAKELGCGEVKVVPLDFRHRRKIKFGQRELNRILPGYGDILKSATGKDIAILPGKLTTKLIVGYSKYFGKLKEKEAMKGAAGAPAPA